MRILIFAHDASLYGASKSLLSLLKEWKKRSDIVVKVLLPYKGNIEDHLNAMEVEYEVIPYSRCVYLFKKQTLVEQLRTRYRYISSEKKVVEAISKAVESFNPHVLYSNTSVVQTGYIFSKRYQLPHVWHIREFGWEDYQFKYISGKRSMQKKMKDSNCIFVSAALQQYWLGPAPGTSKVIYNGILESAEKNSFRSFPVSIVNIGLLGAIMPGKGQATGIKAVHLVSSRFPNVRLKLYGDAFDKKYFDEIGALCRELKIEHLVAIKNFTDKIDEVYKELDILINCSESEGFGRTVVEAMSKGIPVVGNNSGGIPEIIEHGKDGLLYNGTVNGLADQLSLLLSGGALYENISANAINKAADKFTTQEYSIAVYNFLNKALLSKN